MEEKGPNEDSSQSTVVRREPKTVPKRYSEIFRDFDKLDISLDLQEELQLDADSQSISESSTAECTDQHDVSQSEDALCPQIRCEANEEDANPKAQEADQALCRCEDGVETALQYVKMWCRYAKDLLAWMEKRISLEQEFAKNVLKTAEGARANVTQQDIMPLQCIYTLALDYDINHSGKTRKTTEMLQQRCYQAMTAKRNEVDKWRREFKEQWVKGQKKMNDAVAAFKKAQQQYYQRCEELEKAKAVSAKAVDDTTGMKTLDKRRKSKEEAQTKVSEAEYLYRQSVHDVRFQQEELVKLKERLICHIRKLIAQGDTVLKEATVNMFYFQRQQMESTPQDYFNLETKSRAMKPGEPYLQYILSKPLSEQRVQHYTFLEYIPLTKGNKRKTSNPTSCPQESSPKADDYLYRRSIDGKKLGYSDSDSFSGSMESLSSPAHGNKRLPKTASTLTVSSDDLDERDLESECNDGLPVRARTVSRAEMTHQLKKMKSKMVKCKQCENYIVVSGLECEECGVALHRKCMESFQLECEHRKGTVFGVDLCQLPCDGPDNVPFVVARCTSEIESRALSLQGVYRVSGSKPRVQKLCQAFEMQKEQVDLSDVSPHDITSVLKHFFKELPEPLLPCDQYGAFVAVGKSLQQLSEKEQPADTNVKTDIANCLQNLLHKLPPHCYSTLRHLMSHLQKVSENGENLMSPSNLGIVFGPTLLRPIMSVDMPSLALLENSYQSMLVEFLITHHDQVFGLQQRPSTPPPPVPTAPLPETPPRASRPTDDDVYTGPEHENSTGEPPSESRFKRESSEGYISDKSSSNEAVDQLSPEANERAVLAIRGASSDHPGELVGDPNSDMGTQPHYRFTRQPVKYHRHHNQGTRLPNPGRAARQSAAQARGPGSADSSRSSSPEPGAQRLSQNLDVLCENTYGPHQSSVSAESKMDALLSPREVVQYMLGLDSTLTSSANATSSQAEAAACQADPNTDQSNNRQSSGQSRILFHSPKTAEHRLTSPAQKILSGLKLRRSHSGKDEQLFV